MCNLGLLRLTGIPGTASSSCHSASSINFVSFPTCKAAALAWVEQGSNVEIHWFNTHDFRTISPLVFRLAGNILALYFPHNYILPPPPRGTYCESILLDSSVVRGLSILNPIDSCSADPGQCFTSFNYFESIGKVGQDSGNCALNYKLVMHNVFYIDPLRTWLLEG